MRTPKEIYDEYKIMPNLQLHQLRVGSVAKLVCDQFDGEVNANDVIAACLFHDMGNIIKSDLTTFPEFLEPQGREYWERVKADFVSRYGANAHDGNVAIAHELGLSKEAIGYIDRISFSRMKETLEGDSLEQKICEYADTRVGPYGILPLRARLAEARVRYLAGKSDKVYYTDDGFEELARCAEEIEAQLFARTSIKPEDINDEAVSLLIKELEEYQVA